MKIHYAHYAKYILISIFVVYVPFTLQTIFVYKAFALVSIVAPTLVGAIFGFLLALLADLRNRLRAQRALFASLVDHSHDLNALMNQEGVFTYVSPSLTYFTGLAVEELLYNAVWMEDFLVKTVHPEDIFYLKAYYEHGAKGSIEFRFVRPDGSFVWVEHTKTPIENNQHIVVAYRFSAHDITQRKAQHDKIEALAHFDQLTELPNRRLLAQNLKTMLSKGLQSDPFALLFVDLDRFKYINDTFGHSIGDILLKEVALRMRTVINHSQGTVYRFGGDEFIVLLKESSKVHDVQAHQIALEKVAHKLLAAINRYYKIENITMYIGATIGVSRFPQDAKDAETLIKYADLAMYQAKKSKHQQVVFFDHSFSQERATFYEIEQALRDAIGNGELSLYFQPQFDMHTMEVVGVEALARWIKPDGSMISPVDFIPVAEETGMIVELGNFIIDESIRVIHNWLRHGYHYKMAINLSPFQLQATHQYEALIARIQEHDIPAHILEFEITEGILLEQTQQQIQNLSLLRKAGFGVSIDDFGTGFSSLSYLRSMPINMIKIDRTFTQSLTDDAKNQALIESIIALAHNFDMQVIAEGIETQEQLEVLKAMNCDYIQGFLLAKPMDEKALELFLSKE